MASPVASIADRREHISLPSDEILEEIFLRLPTPETLARASAACTTFRRVITDRLFLRRYRKLRPPPLLGLISDRGGGFHPAEAPHPSARLARALLDAADFTYSFVPKPREGWLSPWHPRDVRDGRVLLDCRIPGKTFRTAFAVCDPVSRRYVVLPPVPDEDIAGRPAELAPVLAPVGEHEDERSFKVICMVHYETRLVAFVFSSVTGQWCISASPTWSSLGTGRPRGFRNSSDPDGCRGLSSFDCVRGCFYSASPWMDKFLVLDTRRMEFSVIHDRDDVYKMLRNMLDPPAGQHRRRPGQTRSLPGVVGGEGSLELLSLVGAHNPNASPRVYHSSQQSNGEPCKSPRMNIIPLCGSYDYFTVGAAEGFLFLGATKEDRVGQYHVDMVVAQDNPYDETPLLETWDVDYFSVELRTSEVTKICTMKKSYFNHERVHSYFGYPPSLSTPTI
ncbi:uncharacterized protein [Lolium perenne]|uniref:uncharacterized protein n=1 Tax=Lolium perenne TaxID=4522 RepID=UPI0021EAC1FB|nr:uncharacterized protein LOC127308468 [Lolium perenne]